MKIIRIAFVAALAAGFLATLPYARGGADDKKPSLRYMRTYEEAMLEARIRGVPIYHARHKDE